MSFVQIISGDRFMVINCKITMEKLTNEMIFDEINAWF